MAFTISVGSRFRAISFALTAIGLVSSASAAMPLDRIRQPVDNANLRRLRGNVHPLARSTADLGRVSASTRLERMKLIFQPTAAQQSELEALLAQQQDADSPNYHKWLTPEQFADRFGLSQRDITKIAGWLQGEGFTIAEVARGRNYIAFTGTAAQVEASLHTPIHLYNVNGEWHYANAMEPSIPAAFSPVVSGIAALHNFYPKPRLVRPRPRVTSSVTGNHFMQPRDFATIYNLNGLYNSGIDGTGQTIAVMAQTDLVTDSSGNLIDVNTFRTNSSLSTPANLTRQLVTGSTDPGIQSGDLDEANLDVEWAGGIAKNASVLYVIANPNSGGTFDALEYAASNNLAPVISISYGLCEQQLDMATQTALTNAAQQANAQGQTIVAPSGDSGAADCDSSPNATTATQGLAVDFPGSIPNVTSMGGSEFTGDTPNSASPCAATQYWSGGACTVGDTSATALSYIPEMVWNDTATDQVLSAGGGGLSILFTQPPWQSGLAAITNGMRGVPDISFSASADHDGYLICSYDPTAQTHTCTCGFRDSCTVNTTQGTFDATGGTSAAVPAFAGIVALINQQTHDRQGNVNPVLYSLATSAPNAFHDITAGNNIVPCTIGTADCSASTGGQIGYSAAVGYDLASGLGSLNVGQLLAAWGTASTPGIQINAQSPAVTATSDGTITDSLTVNPVGGLTGTIDLSCSVSSSLPGVTCSVNPTSLTSGGAVAVTIVAPPTLTNMSGTVTVTAACNGVIQTLVISVNVQIPLQFVAVSPCRIADTRNPTGEFGGPAIQGGTSRDFAIPDNSACGIPSTAAAYSLNVTVVPQGSLGFLTLWPSGQPQPLISTLNSFDGRVKANAAVVPAGANEAISVYASNTTNVVLDINGYFLPRGSTSAALTFYPVTPCRVVDTRNADGPLAGPSLTRGQAREFPVLTSSCGLPGGAQAYSMNFTAVPHGPLGFLTVWPSDRPQPFVSTLNAYSGQDTANAAIVPAAGNGDISVYVSDASDVVIDVDGYFAAPSANGLSLYPSTPCRVLDTRNSSGAFANGLTVNVVGGPCGLPATAQTFVLNATVVPASSLGYLSLWPDGEPQPLVSTLNADDAATTSNMAIVPTTNGFIDAFASSSTQLILDLSSFFAQ